MRGQQGRAGQRPHPARRADAHWDGAGVSCACAVRASSATAMRVEKAMLDGVWRCAGGAVQRAGACRSVKS